MGYRTFILCLKQLMSNWKIALQLSWAWLAVIILFTVFARTLVGAGVTNSLRSVANITPESFIGSFLVIFIPMLIVVFAIISIAIGWHRYVLLGEQPPKIHLINFQWPLGSYFWKSIKIAILFILIAIPVVFIATSLITSFSSSLLGLGGNIQMFLLLNALLLIPLNIFFTWLILRTCLVLPATAIGKELGIFESFAKTSNYSGQIFILAVLLTILYFLPGLFQLIFFDFKSLVGLNLSSGFKVQSLIFNFIQLIFNWITLFVSIGILTVLYGHLYEDRQI